MKLERTEVKPDGKKACGKERKKGESIERNRNERRNVGSKE